MIVFSFICIAKHNHHSTKMTAITIHCIDQGDLPITINFEA